MTATCTTPECPEQGIGKPLFITLAPGEAVLCGECGHPCEMTGEAKPA